MLSDDVNWKQIFVSKSKSVGLNILTDRNTHQGPFGQMTYLFNFMRYPLK